MIVDLMTNQRSTVEHQNARGPATFEPLLNLFDSDPEVAAERYEVMRLKLQAFFRWRGAGDPDSLVDETMDRVLNRVCAGAIIHSPSSYFYSVARHLLREESQKNRRFQTALLKDTALTFEQNPLIQKVEQLEEADAVQRLACLNECLSALPAQQRELIVRYYQYEGAKSSHRKQMADLLGIPINALRIRVFRIRARVAECTLRRWDLMRTR